MDTRIAIIGMSAILPGGENVFECAETIRAGLNKIQELPDNRVDVTAYFNPDKAVKDKIYCKRGGFIPDFDFDAREYGMNMFQMEDSDANQTLSLLKVKEALQDGGVEPFTKKKKNIGCVLGIGGGQKASHEFYSRLNYVVVEKVLKKMGMPEEDIAVAVDKYKANFPEWRLDSFPGFLGNVTAGRCTNVFNMDGMNCVVDAACASSLIALKVAIDELLHGDCDMMITGATCTDNSIGMYMAFSKTPVFSTDKGLTAYDKDTKGMLIGEGSCMFLLKRYADAVRDGDDIHAVIRGCASSSDGKASGIYTPTIDGQEEAIRRAYQRAGVDPGTVTLVEGHGTGTPVGDKIELTALNRVMASGHGANKEQVAVGSIKSQIGHLKAVAGYAGMIKVIMALKHKMLPKTINVKNPPTLVDGSKIQDSALYINTENRPWFTEPGMPRRAGISSFGFGGANYHCVLEEFENDHEKAYRMNHLAQPVLLSASTTQNLVALVKEEISSFDAATDFVTYNSFVKKYVVKPIVKSHARFGFLARDASQVLEVLKACLERLQKDLTSTSWTLIRQSAHFRSSGIDTEGKVAALFSGQGAQYSSMFADVAMNWPQFRRSVQTMDKASTKISGNRTSAVLYPRKPYDNEAATTNEEISSVRNAQQTTVACSLGVFDILSDAGLKADFVAGHSLGEFSALYAAGVVTQEQVCEIVCHRAESMSSAQKNATCGAMAAIIGTNADKIQPSAPQVWIANKNSSSQVVLTGNPQGLKTECDKLSAKGFKVVSLACSDAFHSPYMQNAQDKFVSQLSSMEMKNFESSFPKMYSNVTAKPYPVGSSPKEILTKHMVSSVRWVEQVKEMYNAGARIFVEFGPKQTLTKLVSDILGTHSDAFTVAVNPSSKGDSDTQLRECAVKLAVLGVPLRDFDNWEVVNPFKLKQVKRKKTTLRLSATTYTSKKTLMNREKVMNDGRKITYISKAIPKVDNTKINELERRLKQAEEEASQLQRQLVEVQKEAAELRSKQSFKPDASGSQIVSKHRQQLKTMLNEYDEIISKVEGSSTASPTATVSPELLQKAETVVLEVLAAKTGYEVDMIESDMELETELGIDSIKRVEILSEVQAMLNVEAKDVDALSRTRTVGEVVDAMKNELQPSGTSSVAPVAPAATTSAVSPEQLQKAETVVLEVLAAKTGYEVDMIESDMELETELGIDSIKRVEILSEVQTMLNVEAKNVDALSRTRTVGEVIDAMKKEILSVDSTSLVTEASDSEVALRATGCEELDLTFPSLIQLEPAASIQVQNAGKVLLVGGSNSLISVIKGQGREVVQISNSNSEEGFKGAIEKLGAVETVVYIHSGEPVENCLIVAKYVKKILSGTRQQFMVVVRGDGLLGYGGKFSSLDILEKYSLCGLAKTIALEWPNVQARCIDIHESLSNSQLDDLIVKELGDTMRTLREVSYDSELIRRGVATSDLKSGKVPKKVGSEDVWLVCGGARGITPLCVRELAKRVGGGTYYLMGRSKLDEIPSWAVGVEDKDLQKAAIRHIKSQGEKPRPAALRKLVNKVIATKEVKQNIAEIGSFCDGKVHYISCDITSRESVKSALAKLPTITGLFHASGVLRDKLIVSKSVEDFRTVYNTKVTGFKNVWDYLDQSALRHCILFSSLAGFHGNVGQSDYSMANEVLNKIAYMLNAKGISAKAFDFGPWDGGMVTPALKKHFQSQGVQIIDRPGGATSVATMITDCSPSQILVGNWGLPPSKPDQRKFVLHQQLKVSSLLDDHKIQGKKVLPFTFCTSLLIDKVLGLYPGYHLLKVEDVNLFKGITVENDVDCEITLEETREEAGKVYVSTTLKQLVNQRTIPSYKAQIVIGEKALPKKIIPVESFTGKVLSKENVYGDILFHGPKFQGIQRAQVSGGKLQAHCELPADVPAQPVALDLLFQAALILAKEVRGVLSLPSNAEEVQVYQPITSDSDKFQITMSKDGGSNSDNVWKLEYTMHDIKGNVFNEGRISIVLNDKLKY